MDMKYLVRLKLFGEIISREVSMFVFPWLEILFCIQFSKLEHSYAEVGNYIESDKYSTNLKEYSTTELDIKAFDFVYLNNKTKINLYNTNEMSYINEIGVVVKDTIKLGFRNTYIDYNAPFGYDVSHPKYSPEYNEMFFRLHFKDISVDNFDWLQINTLLEISKIVSGTTQLGITQRKDDLYTKLQYQSVVEAQFIILNYFYITYGFKTKMVDTSNYSFYPYQVSNKIESGVLLKNLTIGIRHYCVHPESPWDYVPIHDRFNASYDEIFISYKIKL